MKYIHEILAFLLPAFIALGLASCSNTDAPTPPDGKGEGKYIQLSLSMAAGTRAEAHTPTEPGVNNENRVHDICLFFYTAEEGINAPASTPIDKALYFDGLDLDLIFGVPVRIDLELGEENPFRLGQRVVVLINMGDQSHLTTLGEVRNLQTRSWQEAASIPDYDRFTITTASADDGVLGCAVPEDMGGAEAGSRDNPYRISATVERTAARIDFAFSESNIAADGSLVYKVTDRSGDVVARAYFTDMELFNLHQQTPYAIKRVTEDLNISGLLHFAAEEETNGGKPSNYVIEPNTLRKRDDSPLETFFGTQRRETLTPDIFDAESDIRPFIANRLSINDDYTTILTYANESTQEAGLAAASFAPGIAIKARYVPREVKGDGVDYKNYDAPLEHLTRYEPTAGENKGKTLWFTSKELAFAHAADYLADSPKITEYPGGICYYLLHLRHHLYETSNPASPQAMEYAVVRNHIYRVAVTVTGPGMLDFSQEKPEGLDWRIFVKEWNFRLHPTIIM